ncbi:uncharacterized protein PV09_00914 [Verruconis gallopava]|uniref:C2H2-type domain-containing protein n=1 Tax=Verruconis gallopava TaxID=253628 RepID=A0A0D2BCF1_9PEZI|nr:uncharacterized protein PV09_00914 [Verruconis gallopava]KIW09019.1 hypothetical protein PV09_00914 [Verruconis gallopava]
MRPSRNHKTARSVRDCSGESAQVKHHRLRRTRRQDDIYEKQESGDLATDQKIITRKERTPLSKSHASSFDLSVRLRTSKSHEMPSGASLPSVGHGPKLTKTGRVSKAKKGIKGAHRCGCGKTYSRAEHLRRHQQNHEKQLPCLLCGKIFHRQDLYDRHLATKHDSSNSMSRRDSATSGSPISPLHVQTSLSSGLAEPVLASQRLVEPNDQFSEFPQNSHFLSRHHTGEAPSSPSSGSDASYIKDEPYPQPYFTNDSFGELSATTTESDPVSYLVPRPSLSSSGDVSPFSPFSFSASWAHTNPIFTHSALTETIPFAYNSSSITSPRTLVTHMQMPSWIESNNDIPHFPPSGLTSPSSSCAPAMAPVVLPSHPNGAPYPLAFVAQKDKYGSLDIESPLEEQQLGVELSLKTKQHYLEAYWTRFDPFFPIVHKPSHRPGTNPLLTAAMMAIGAQYADEEFARSDSRILHEKCLELIAKYKDVLLTATRLDYMQAIFLVEVMSHYRAKRTAPRLSEVFLSVYASLWKFHTNTGRSYIESLSTIQPQLSDDDLRLQWSEWVATTGFCRLLAACYVFETMQALLLVRSTHTTPSCGLELLIPAPAAVWDASSHVRWAQMIRQHQPEILDMSEILDALWTSNTPPAQRDPFQSSILIACHAGSVLLQKNELQNPSFNAPSAMHTLFEPGNIGVLERCLYAHPSIITMHHIVQLASLAPFRALLATSGESWVLSQRLSQDSLIAAAEFTTLKSELRSWTDATEQTFFSGSTGDNIRSAVQHSLLILKACLNAPISGLAFGPDMALYFACLTLWAVTYSASSKAEAAGMKFDSSAPVILEPSQARQDARTFCDFAVVELSRNYLDRLISDDRISSWRHSVNAVLRWSSWALGGMSIQNRILGELIESAVGVLDCLKDRGWQDGWF